MILVPFTVTIPKADRDRRLGDTLKAEGAGILNWMLAGLWDYQTNGLNVSRVIQAATAAYRSEQDLIGEWIADNCVTGAGMHEGKRSLSPTGPRRAATCRSHKSV
jgi:putative DNA primase/helicase